LTPSFEGLILKGVGGFYTVLSPDGPVVCRPRGRFRREGIKPLPGDRVVCLRLSDDTGRLDEIGPRKNVFDRPPVANLDLLLIVVSQAIPQSDPFLIDRMTALAARKGLGAAVCVNKIDLAPAEDMARLYTDAGYPTVRVSARSGDGFDRLRTVIAGQVVALVGNSGVGKSSLLNRLCPNLSLATAEVSLKGGRGRHTTRHVELLPMADGAWAADTPGFSLFDEEGLDCPAEEMDTLFPEFQPHLGLCRFTGCRHTGVVGCAVETAVLRGEIAPSRWESYKRLYDSASKRRAWERNGHG
jgi:ribosome biogenesis GTPase